MPKRLTYEQKCAALAEEYLHRFPLIDKPINRDMLAQELRLASLSFVEALIRTIEPEPKETPQ